MKELVSVIIPTHNRANLLFRAVESVLKQSYAHFEIIIVNDASTDQTPIILNQLEKLDSRIKTISNITACGGSRSRNIGIQASQGQWIAFLDDDDTWHMDKLKIQLAALHQHPHAVACSSGYIIHYPYKIKKNITTPPLIALPDLLKNNSLGGSSVCICVADIAKKINGFDDQLKSAQDWDFWIRLRMEGEIISIEQPLVNYYVHFNFRISNNMSAKYLGSRSFYFKYKKYMDHTARVANLSFICFIQSRQRKRKLLARIRKLFIAIRYASFGTGVRYFLSSVPRLLMQN